MTTTAGADTGADTAAAPTRRERLRAATSSEIVEAARGLLRSHGATAVSLRAIAREMGMSAPALYRYFPSHEDLVQALVAEVYDDLVAELERSRDLAGGTPGRRLCATARAFRRWGVAHVAEMGLLFGEPIPGRDCSPDTAEQLAAARFGAVFASLFAELWATAPFPVRPDEEIAPALREELVQWSPPDAGLPAGALEVFLRCWMRLYGSVLMEVFDHLKFAVGDGSPLFELELGSSAALIGVSPEDVGPD